MNSSREERSSQDLAVGFSTSVAMWAIGYVAMMRPGVVAGEALFVLILATALAGGFIAGKFAAGGSLGAGAAHGARAGLWSAAANLLIVGSLFGGDTDASVWSALAIWVGGLFAATTLIMALGGAIGARGVRWTPRLSTSAVFARATCVAIFLLLVTGGLVTGLEAGLAVPDWPNSFGHNMLLYPLAEMKGGVYYEHAHRLYGMLVGVSSLALLVLVLRSERSGTVRALAIAGFVMVCAQGVMGGMRVTGRLTLDQNAAAMQPSLALAVVHGVFGQIVFATYCLLATLLGPKWKNESITPIPECARARITSAILVAVLLIQLISGALYRHLQVPQLDAAPKHPAWAMHLHVTWAAVAFVVTLLVGLRAMRVSSAAVPLRAVGHALLMFVGLQVAFGIGSLVMVILRKGAEIPTLEIVFTSLHQSTGALLLGASVVLAAWWRRVSEQSQASARA